MIHLFAAHLLRRHVAYGAHNHARVGQRLQRRRFGTYAARQLLRLQLRQPEVENLDAPVFRDKQVFRFEVAMHDAALVCSGKSGGDLLRVVNRATHRQRALIELRAQFLAFQQFGDEERQALVRADVVNRQDVRVVQCRGRARLLLEAAQAVGVFGELGRQGLDGDLTIQSRVAGFVDFAHATCAQRSDDFVMVKTSFA
ncbi:MAG: hypothetical protein JMDDDDMK_00440 [Acidobacteria bacterium]|nr:hypothetical protein [Acidobacteriota bacterium]